MKPFILLIAVFVAFIVISRFTTGDWNLSFGGNLAMCLMLCFTAAGHFMFTKGMSMMVPAVIPFKTQLVYLTGVIEIILGILLLFPSVRPYSGWILIVFFILITPANILATLKQVNIEKGTFDGPATNYLWFRIPLQFLFIGWVYYFISFCQKADI